MALRTRSPRIRKKPEVYVAGNASEDLRQRKEEERLMQTLQGDESSDGHVSDEASDDGAEESHEESHNKSIVLNSYDPASLPDSNGQEEYKSASPSNDDMFFSDITFSLRQIKDRRVVSSLKNDILDHGGNVR